MTDIPVVLYIIAIVAIAVAGVVLSKLVSINWENERINEEEEHDDDT